MTRLADLTETVVETIETLRSAATMPSHYIESCGDLAPEELCTQASRLMELARLASTLAELAIDTLAEEQS